jgi:hypothetical protein
VLGCVLVTHTDAASDARKPIPTAQVCVSRPGRTRHTTHNITGKIK